MKSTVLLLAAILMTLASPARAQDADLRGLVSGFAEARNFTAVAAIVDELAATGDPAVTGVLEALSAGSLHYRKSDRAVFIVRAQGGTPTLVDPLTAESAGEAITAQLEKIKVNNSLRRAIRDAMGRLTVMAADPARRHAAARSMFGSPDPAAIPLLDDAIEAERDEAVRRAFVEARAAAVLVSDLDAETRRAAVATIGARGDREALAMLRAFQIVAPDDLKPAVAQQIALTEQTLAWWGAAQNVWYGLSLGSVLLLAAIGLAITFGVMGVINMAHGEMVMLGAYTTFAVQSVIHAHAPWLLDVSLLIALPLAFAAAGAVGIGIERGVIRHLYGRPLETLLATWGISLILQQAVRTTFGAQNRQVVTPSWMSGGFEVGQMAVTYNRLWIAIFALTVFAVLLVGLNKSGFGLQMRAVTQNRQMAKSMGIRTPRIDALTFGLGSGIAGIAGVALSQISNVSPNLGQGYLIDSFMVVVFGGVGSLWGTLVGAMSLGILNKFLEPYAGAVLGKILVLVLIILFIQKRPRGLFALKGRAAEA
jgi:urea transport system permease protein